MSEELRQRAVEYLLGEMDQADRSAFEAECRTDAELDGLVEELRPVISRLEELPTEAWDPPEPPPLVMPGSPPEPSPARTHREPTRNRAGLGWLRAGASFAAALVILAAGVVIGTQLDGDGPGSTDAPQKTLALESIGDEVPTGASGEVSLTSSGDDAVTLDVSGLNPTGSDEFYELWLLGKEGELVALGTFRVEPDGDSQIEVPLPVNPDDYEYFDVSIQPENGDPSHSGRSVLRGLTRA